MQTQVIDSLGAVISQDNHPIAFHSRKLNDAQTHHATTERELLSVVEKLKEFRMTLLGHKIVTWTDHKNLIHNDLKSERVSRWHLLMEEHGPETHCVKGPENIAADALSRLPASDDPEKLHVMPSREELAECFAEDVEPTWSFPVSIALIKSFQQRDNNLTQKAASDNPAHSISPFRGGAVICHNDKAVTPLQLRTHVAKWHHKMLCHPGERRAEETTCQHLTWPGLKTDVLKCVLKNVQIARKARNKRKNTHTCPPKDKQLNRNLGNIHASTS
jgi:hypothetical protein